MSRSLQPTEAELLVWRSSLSLSAAAAAELNDLSYPTSEVLWQFRLLPIKKIS